MKNGCRKVKIDQNRYFFRVENSVSVLPDHEDGHEMGICHENHTLVNENF